MKTMLSFFESPEQPIRRVGFFYTGIMTPIMQVLYFSLGAFITDANLKLGICLSLVGGLSTGVMLGYLGGLSNQIEIINDGQQVKFRYLIESMIQMAGLGSIPFACMFLDNIGTKEFFHLMLTRMIGHFFVLSCKAFLLLLFSTFKWSFLEDYGNSLKALGLYFEVLPPPILLLENQIEVVAIPVPSIEQII